MLGEHAEDVLYESEWSRVVRVRAADRCVVRKEARGRHAVRRIRREREMLERLAGVEGVVRVLGGSTHALVMEDVPGPSLAEILRERRLDLSELLKLAERAARVLADMHRAGVLHGDLSPGNLLVTDAGPVLIDFDRAMLLEEIGATVEPSNPAGLAYAAPEQSGRTGYAVDQRADLYTLGVTLYEAATGRPPFGSEDPLELLREHLAQAPIPPATLEPSLPQTFSDIILRLLEKEPDRRYRSAEGLAHDLTALREAAAQGQASLPALGTHDFPPRLAAPTHLIGRRHELAALREAFEEARRGKCRGIFIVGPAGAGKTALAGELRTLVVAEGSRWIGGKFEQYRGDIASGAVLQAFGSLGRLLLAEPEDQLAGRRGVLLEALGLNAGLVAILAPEFGVLLGPVAAPPPSDSANAEARLRLALLDVLRCTASPEQPLAVMLDDLQWADAGGLRFIEGLLEEESARGLFLLGCCREPEEGSPLAEFLARWERLDIAPPILRVANLSSEAVNAFVGEMLRLPAEHVESLARVLETRTGGNPYDTVELLNELRRDGVVSLEKAGWCWDESGALRHIGRAEVVEITTARIARLPAEVRETLCVMACIGSEVSLRCLEIGCGMEVEAVRKHLLVARQAGLVTLPEGRVCFFHDRVQQAAYALLGGGEASVRLAVARRLAARNGFTAEAARLYLAALPLVREEAEGRRVVRLLREEATAASLAADYLGAYGLLTGAVDLSDVLEVTFTDPGRVALEEELHACLYSLARYEQADLCYARLESAVSDPVALAEAACRQIGSLFNRGRFREAVLFGVGMLRRLGREPAFGDAPGDDAREQAAFRAWFSGLDLQRELERPQVEEPRVSAALWIMEHLEISALYGPGDGALASWIAFESKRIWEAHGPSAALIACICAASPAFLKQEDYRTAYKLLRFALACGQARGYEPETSWAHCLFVMLGTHWGETLESCMLHSRQAYEELLRYGDVQNAVFAFGAGYSVVMDCEVLDVCEAEAEAGLTMSRRLGNEMMEEVFLAHRQLIRGLRGEVAGDFDEAAFGARVEGRPSSITFFLNNALTAAIFDDGERLIRYGQAASAYFVRMFTVQSMYRLGVTGRLLWALAIARRLRDAPPDSQESLLRELDELRAWFAARAVEVPENYAHLAHWLDAERAWALDDPWGALRAFDAAIERVRGRKRPWHYALIMERAGLLCLEQGMERMGRAMMAEAHRLYGEWGAAAKVRNLEERHAFLQEELEASRTRWRQWERKEQGLSARDVDVLGILRAARELSSQTDLSRLRERIVALLSAMTGATKVSIALRRGPARGFVLLASQAGEAELPVEQAAAARLLPLSVFRYALRSGETFTVADAASDDRFRDDPYFVGLERCALLVVPIFSQGAPLAVVLLENRVSSGAFSQEGLEALKLIAGQLTVSLENTLLYTSLEEAYEREKHVAHVFQEAALDQHLPCVPGLTLNAIYRPGSDEAQVGGDWYDVFRLPDGRLVLSVGDVAGSGLGAAVTMASVRQSIRTAALINPNPAMVLEAVNRIVRATEQERFVTAFVGVLDPLSFELSYASAGHVPPLLRAPDGSVRELWASVSCAELPLGLQRHDSVAEASLSLEPGSLLLLYTDGLIELDHEPLTELERLVHCLRGLGKSTDPAGELYRTMLGAKKQRDDIAILSIQCGKPLIDMQAQGWTVRWEFDVCDAETAHAKHRAFAVILEEAGFTAAELSSAEVVFGELLGNVVRYAGRTVTIVLDLSGEAPVLHVQDQGRGFEHNRRLPQDLMSEYGRGLFLVSAFTEELSISRRKEGGSHARAVLSGKIRGGFRSVDFTGEAC